MGIGYSNIKQAWVQSLVCFYMRRGARRLHNHRIFRSRLRLTWGGRLSPDSGTP
jgi:hypothetical protein